MSAKTAARRKTPEQYAEEREALVGSIGDKVAALTSSEEWAAYLRFAGAFHKYSLNNVLLILAQCPNATQVAGYRVWQSLGRQVAKGQKSIKIFGYSSRKVTETDTRTGEESERRIPTFPILSVFDISQTEGDDVPSGGYAVPTGDDSAGIWDRLCAWLTGEGWTVSVERIGGGPEGYTSHATRRVVISDRLDPAGRAAVLLHEAGHVVLHADLAPGEYQQHRGIYETEAESVGYVLANLLGQPADANSIPYIAGWANADRELIQRTAANVLRAVHEIAAGIGLDEPAADRELALA